MALNCCITAQGRTLVLYNVHLESRGKDELRRDQLSEIRSEIEHIPAETPVVVAGDFNFDLSRVPAAPLIANMRLDNPFARPGGRPTVPGGHHAKTVAIDWILTGKALSASDPEIHDSVGASDHYPLTLQLRWRDPVGA